MSLGIFTSNFNLLEDFLRLWPCPWDTYMPKSKPVQKGLRKVLLLTEWRDTYFLDVGCVCAFAVSLE